MVQCPYVIRPQCSKIFSKIAWPIKAKFYVEPPSEVGTIVCLRHLGHMTKETKMDFSETIAACNLKLNRSRHLIEYMKICEY